MPWAPELFSTPVLQSLLDKYRRERLRSVPFFDGLLSGEVDALVESFSGVPEIHHPVSGRIKGEQAFRRFVADMTGWLAARNAEVEAVNMLLTDPRGVEEDERIVELRMYFSSWPLTGRHAHRPPLLQPDPAHRAGDVIGEYQRALAAGDVEGVLATFEPGGLVREPAGDGFVHRGTGELRALYERFFSNGGGIPLEHCTVIDDGSACALEYNVVTWGRTALPPEAGLAVYVRGDSGRLRAARVYDDCEPPLGG